MKARVLVPFCDKYNRSVTHLPGEDVDFDDDRVAALAARGLVEPAETPAAKPKTARPKAKTKAAATD